MDIFYIEFFNYFRFSKSYKQHTELVARKKNFNQERNLFNTVFDLVLVNNKTNILLC